MYFDKTNKVGNMPYVKTSSSHVHTDGERHIYASVLNVYMFYVITKKYAYKTSHLIQSGMIITHTSSSTVATAIVYDTTQTKHYSETKASRQTGDIKYDHTRV